MLRKKKSDKTEAAEKKPGFITRLRARINKGDSWLTTDVKDLIPGGRIDEDTLEELETRLLLGDVGVDATEHIIDGLRKRLKRTEMKDLDALMAALRESMLEIVAPAARPLDIDTTHQPFVILMLGVNGAGKTTTIGKLARRYLDDGYSVMLAAADTFRAAAIEQLQAWGERNDVPVVAQRSGADPSAVVYDALEAARARGVDVLIADTAGRLHTQSNLMEELKKIKRVLGKLDPSAPQETLLVIDATNGQNALSQARQFHADIGLTGVCITKLDGSAKGGILLAIARELDVPIRYIGIGEQIDDLDVFDAESYVDALLQQTQQP
ncbi:MAG: signal recognition particle-docking protein FtsY [Gammaproteobacteria bacterium]|nr:signal recognition particle-docking protein FtsY [Gammaproteobacteria bacterium]NNF62354.1 signal recognition particle-docking protein FtsY [Gammaproteobacteria bacterium]NNM21223.1 signal recognition particle-docking protein FtsY [Gammaproteobacteria bacterium]